MANICNTCKHPDVDTINKRIVDKVSVRKIVAEFPDLSDRGVYRHKDTCLRELYASVIVQKRAGLLASVDRALNEIDELKRDFPENPNVRLGIVGKLLDVIDREAKLTGAYLKEADNPSNLDPFIATLSKWVDDHRRAGIALPAEEIADEAERLARANNVPPDKLIDAMSELVQ